MGRRDDIAAFLDAGALRSLAESAYALPDLPEGLDASFFEKVSATHPIADDPYGKSELRNGLKIWDTVYLPLPKSVSPTPIMRGTAHALRSVNAEWESTKRALEMVGRPDGIHLVRPKGPYILDVMHDDIRLLQGAHILTHRAAAQEAGDDYTFGELARSFAENLARLFLARTYGLGIAPHPERGETDALEEAGISIAVSTDLRAPEAFVPSDSLIPDRSVAVVLCAVGFEAPPSKASQGTSWKEVNKWSCLPTLLALSGWECVDYILHADRIETARGTACDVPCDDLQPMSSFGELLSQAAASGRPNSGISVQEWLASDDFRRGLSVTPQLPCPHCMRVGGKASGAIRRPLHPKPSRTLKELAEGFVSREAQEWIDYANYMRNCIAIGRKATAFATGSTTAMKKRNAAAKRHAETLKRIASLTKRRDRRLANGFLSEAEALTAKIEELKKFDEA